MDEKAIGILLIIAAAIMFFHSAREQRQGQASFTSGVIMGGASVILLFLGFMLLSG